MTFISYAQNFEDVMLWRALKHVPQGFWIDVGAADPDEYSVTRAFSDRGWSGINIEANPPAVARIAKARPRDVTLGVAAGAELGSTAFFEVNGTGMSTMVRAIAEQHRLAGFEIREHEVPLRTLASICAEYAPGEIHFLKIDVEGAERDVLAGADLTNHRPWIVLVEATRPNTQEQNHEGWEPLLFAANYRFAWFDGLNRFYIAAELWEKLSPAYATPPNIFDDFIRATDTEHVDRIAAAEKRAQLAEALATENENLKIQASALSEQLVQVQERAATESKQLTERVAALSQELTQEREQAAAGDKRLRADIKALSEQLAGQESSFALSALRASRYDRLVLELRDEDGPRALRSVLPLARIVRRLHHTFDRGSPQTAKPTASQSNLRPHTTSFREKLRSSSKKGALSIYKALLRPVVRPAMWRLRTFLLQPVIERLDQSRPLGENNTELAKSLEMLALTIASSPPRER